jgi:hypothetical protein
MAEFPDQMIPESQKDLEWCKKHITYGEEVYNQRRHRIANIQKNFDKYNGLVQKKEISYITDKYGNTARVEYKAYKLGKTKIDLMLGEWLLQPLSQTVATTNRDAISKKMKSALVIKGAMASRKEIEYLRKSTGMNILEGMEIPQEDDPNLMEKMNPKTKNEYIMQKLIDDYVKREELKDEFYKNVSDVALAAECFGKNEIQNDGKPIYRRIDPRLAIYEEMEGDTFFERSPILGEVRPMSIHQVLTNYWEDLSPKDQKRLKELSKNPESQGNIETGISYEYIEKTIHVQALTVEWYSVRPEYTKISPNAKNPDDPYKKEMTVEYYEKNKKKIQRDIRKGKYKVKTQYKTDLWEATRIGNEIFTRCRRKPYQYRNQNNAGDVKSSYTGLGFNTHTGTRVSIQEVLQEVSDLYDTAWYQVTREVYKNRGKVLIYDLGALPARKSVTKLMNEITRDGVLFVNSAADQNRGQRDIDVAGIKEVDLGLSSSFSGLLQLIAQLEDTADRITGINENRQGQIAASATATNAQSAIRASRTISEPMFYFIRKYIERVMLKLASDIKLSAVFIDTEEAEQIIGTEGMRFLKMSKDFAFDDYGVYITDGSKEADLRNTLLQLSEVALNAKQLRLQDIMKLHLTDTLAESIAVLEKGFEEVERLNQQNAMQQQEQIGQQQQAVQQMETERREDQQAHEKEMVILEAELENGRAARDAKNTMLLDQSKEQAKSLGQQQNIL